MAYKKSSGSGNGGFRKGGGAPKKEYDPTIVSAKDVLMARMNAVTAVHTLQAAHVAAGTGVQLDIDAEVERIFQDTLAQADHGRIGSANKTKPTTTGSAPKSSVKKAESAVTEAFGEEDEPSETSDDEVPYVNLVINKGKHAGNSLGDIFEEDPSYVTNYLVVDPDESENGKGNPNSFTRKAARAFCEAQGIEHAA